MFHRPSFNPVSFSRISFNGASRLVEQDGRSGYWRLFFTQLQEDSEKKPVEGVQVHTAKSGVRLKVRKLTSPKPPESEDDDDTYEIPYAPIARPQLQMPQPSYVFEAWRITTEIRGWLIQHRVNEVKYHLTRDAANDEDDIELLLLVA